ncbi:hypothetical protein V3C99_012197 [Haemonchus contortus]|uniref:Large proline-rich protein BAG6 n=1 Tax=Haemonchus contortus TaxID=6289 RepID=A0A7I4Y2W7_HAECO
MQPAGLLEESVVPLGAEETIVTSDVSGEGSVPSRHVVSSRQIAGNGVSTDGPPVIPRFDNTGGSYSGRVTSSRVLSPLTGTRVVQPASTASRSPLVVPSGAGKLLMVRRSDGTTQFLRQIPQPLDEAVSTATPSVSRLPQNIRVAPGSRVLQISGREQEQSGHPRLVVASEASVVRTSYDQSKDPFMKRMAVEKGVSGSTSTSQGMVSHIPRQVELRGEMYSEPVAKGDEQVVYTDQGVRVGFQTPDRLHQPRYVQNSSVHRVTARGPTPIVGGTRVQPNPNSQRVYYVKNAVTVPSRVVLAPAPVESYVREEVVYDNDGYAIDGSEISNHSGVYTS